jgi:hypothetical protein
MALTNPLVTEQHSHATLNRVFSARKAIVNCWLRRNLNGGELSGSRSRSRDTYEENSSDQPRQVKPSASVDRPGQEAFANFTTSDKFSRMCEVNL